MSAALVLPIGGPDRQAVLAVVADGPTREAVNAALAEQNLAGNQVLQGRVDLALKRLRGGLAPRLIVFDVTGSVTPIDDVASLLAQAGPGVALLALGAINDVTLYRDLTRAGAVDYLVKPLNHHALAAAMALAANGPAPGIDRLGKVIVFCGARGGVGTTTAAINTAWVLSHELKQRTALVDLDVQFGTVALALDIDPGRGLREALEQPSRIDSLFIERAMVRQGDTLSVLSAEEPVQDDMEFDPSSVDILLHELRQKFSWVVVDLPRGISLTQRVALSTASHIVLICEPSLAGLRDAMRLSNLAKESAPAARVILIEAGAGALAGRPALGRAEFERGLGRKLDGALPFDAKSAAAAANGGKALAALLPGSPIVKAISRLAVDLAGPAARGVKAGRTWSLFRR